MYKSVINDVLDIYMRSNKDFFLGVLLVTLHRWRLTYAYTNNMPVNLYWILYMLNNYSVDDGSRLIVAGRVMT